MKITVVAAILKDDNLTLVTEKGEYHKILQGDHRLRPVLEQVLPVVSAGGRVEVDITPTNTNVYEEFEKKSNGVVRFFRIARNTLKKWFGSESLSTTVSDGTYGTIPETPKEVEPAVAALMGNKDERDKTLKELISEAKPINGMVFKTGAKEHDLKPEETIIAVVDNQSIMANAEELHAQVAHANRIGSVVAVENFARLVAAVPRQHSMEDLVKFIGKLDTPLTEDGYVLAYKNLNKTDDPEVFVDPYTNKVRQGVGTLVCMNESLVDPNRGQDCSNGLHVASRSYLRGYGGDGGTFLIRIKPSDVIAVPRYSTNKMRVCAYEILGKLNKDDQRAVCSNAPLATDEGKKLLAAAVAGKLPPMKFRTEITAGMGGGCIYTTLDEDGNSDPTQETFEPDTLEDLGMVDPIDPDQKSGVVPDAPVAVDTVTAVLDNANLSRKEQAGLLYDKWVASFKEGVNIEDEAIALAALIAFKKQCKVSWERLGIPSKDGTPIVDDRIDIDLEQIVTTPAKVAADFEQVTKTERDDEADAVQLEVLWDDFLGTEEGSREEYDLAVQLTNLLKESNFEFDENGDCDELMFDSVEFSMVEDAIKAWEQKQLAEKLAPAPVMLTVEVSRGVPKDEKQSPRQHIRELLNSGVLNIGTAKDIIAIKKAAKKGWSALGVNADEAFDIEQQAKTD